MSVTVYGRHNDDAVFEDDNGPARIPLRALAMLHHAADMGRTEYATWQGPPVRRFHRDTLRAVLRDYEDDNLPELTVACWRCSDGDGATCDHCLSELVAKAAEARTVMTSLRGMFDPMTGRPAGGGW